MENHHFQWENPLWPFSIAMLNYHELTVEFQYMSDRQWHAASCLAYACIRLDMAGYGWIQPCELQIFDFVCRGAGSPAPRSFCGAFGAGRDGQRGHQDKEHVTTNTLRSSVFFSLSLSFVYFFFVFFSLYLVMPSPVPVLLPFCLVPCLFFPLMVFFVSSLCCFAFCMLCYCSFAAFFLLCFPASIFVFSCFSVFLFVLPYPCNVCSFSLLCFKFVLQDLFIFLLPRSSPLLQQQQQEQQKQQQEQQEKRTTNIEPPEQPDKNEVVSRSCFSFLFYFVFRFLSVSLLW